MMPIVERLTKRYKILEHLGRQQDLQRDSMAWQWVSQYYPAGSTVPFTAWSASPQLLWHVCNDLLVNRRSHVLEFGGGLSTLVLAGLLQREDREARLVTIEHDPHWAELLDKNLRRSGLEAWVNLVVAPLKPMHSQPGHLWYDTELLNRLTETEPFDLVLVDAPPGPTCSKARYPAVPWLLEHSLLADAFTIFLDDAKRPDEEAILADWSSRLHITFQRNHRYAVGQKGTGFDTRPFGF